MSEEIKVIKSYEPQPPAVPPMSGWKTKYGTIALAIGSALLGAADIAPIPKLVEWLKFLGTVLTGVGGATAAWGLGHKMEKNRPTVQIIQKQEPMQKPKPATASITKESP